jgi:hypothetical protein
MLQQQVSELSQRVLDLQAHSTPSLGLSLAPVQAAALTGQQDCIIAELSVRQVDDVVTHLPKSDEIDTADEAAAAVSDQAVGRLRQHSGRRGIDVCLQHDAVLAASQQQQLLQATAVSSNAASSAGISSNSSCGNLCVACDNSLPNDAATDAGILPSPRGLSRVWGSGLSTETGHDSIDTIQQGFEGKGCSPTKRCSGCSCPKQPVAAKGCDSVSVAPVSELCDGESSSSCNADSNCRWLQGSRAEVWTQTGFEPLSQHGTAGKREVTWVEIIADMF